MSGDEHLRAELEAAMSDAGPGVAAANGLCVACVELLHVDGAAISLMHHGASQGTFGSSGELSRRLDELQFTYGEGPCMDAVSEGRPVLVPDIDVEMETRWPAFAAAMLEEGVRAVFALPSAVATNHIGVLDLFRRAPGPMSPDDLTAGLVVAELAALPLLNLMAADVDWAAVGDGSTAWAELASLERVEVYQATGMIMEHLDVGPTEALVRLRAHAFATGQTASEVAWKIVERRLQLDHDGAWQRPGEAGSAP